MTKVTIYSTPTCHYCQLAKNYFKEHQIEFEDIDVAADQAKAQEMIAKSGQLGTPVIIVEKEGQEKVVVGFRPGELDRLLGAV